VSYSLLCNVLFIVVISECLVSLVIGYVCTLFNR
jgi:hypothetical protein